MPSVRRPGSATAAVLHAAIVASLVAGPISAAAQDAPIRVPATAPASAADGTIDKAALPRDALVIVTPSGQHPFTVEIADDPVERQRGLMFRAEMARDAGMLFDFGSEDERAFWMRNTILPLDIIYARSDGTVISIARNTTPYSLDSIPSNGKARFVLEVNAGVADEIGLRPGARIVHRRVAD